MAKCNGCGMGEAREGGRAGFCPECETRMYGSLQPAAAPEPALPRSAVAEAAVREQVGAILEGLPRLKEHLEAILADAHLANAASEQRMEYLLRSAADCDGYAEGLRMQLGREAQAQKVGRRA